MKLVMTILVKNEEDIIENNIRFHAAQGVDAFMVMDNNSTDRTPQILAELQKDYDVRIIHNPSTTYQQAEWMTSLAKQARRELKADLVISNDADEFWSANDGRSLKDNLDASVSLLTVPRYNFLIDRESMGDGSSFLKTPYKVVSPILYSREDQINRSGLAMPLVRISPKVIVNPFGLIKIKGGNHRARHLFYWSHATTSAIEVHHYPIRSYQQFERNILNRQRLLNEDPATRMGVHYKRWVELLKAGQLQQEFDDMCLSKTEIGVLERIGVVENIGSSPLQNWDESRSVY